MRTYKFRSWNGKLNEMFYGRDVSVVVEDNGQLDSYTFHNSERVNEILMQYTGLNDTDGREIYEGDIVEYKNTSLGDYDDLVGVVKFMEYTWLIDSEDKRRANPLFSETAELKVIGNYFEGVEVDESATKN